MRVVLLREVLRLASRDRGEDALAPVADAGDVAQFPCGGRIEAMEDGLGTPMAVHLAAERDVVGPPSLRPPPALARLA